MNYQNVRIDKLRNAIFNFNLEKPACIVAANWLEEDVKDAVANKTYDLQSLIYWNNRQKARIDQIGETVVPDFDQIGEPTNIHK